MRLLPERLCPTRIHTHNTTDWSLYHYLDHDRWVLLLFIPAAFSFVCPTEVLAFSDCIEEFAGHQTSVAFISTDTKHVMWHWQELPRKHGGLGKCLVPLLADPSHQITRSWGILVENEGVALRGMFLVDPHAVVQHVSLPRSTTSILPFCFGQFWIG